MNLTKTLSPFVWAILFQLRDLKLPDLNKLYKNGQGYHYLVLLFSFKWGNLHHSYLKK